jgi:hypothetical protein
MSERETQTAIQLALSNGDTRLFRFNSGQAWAGTIVKRTPTLLVLANYHPVKLGPTGYADLTGWTGPLATFAAIEVKYGRNRATTEQLAFIDLVKKSGGRAGVAYSVDEARHILYGR